MAEEYEVSMESENDIAEKLIELRRRAGLTQGRAAEGMGLTRASLNAYENGIRKPKIHAAKRIAEYYGVPVDYLLGYSIEYEEKHTPQTQILLQTLKGASEKEIAQAIRIVEALKGTMPDD